MKALGLVLPVMMAGFVLTGTGVSGGTSPIGREAAAEAEQELALAYDALGRESEAVPHYRAALALDPGLKACWANLAIHALTDNDPERAAHLASVAMSFDPAYATARSALERARELLPPDDARRAAGRPACPAPEGGAGTLETCLERRAGWFAGTGEDAREPLVALARFELSRGAAPLAAYLLTIAKSLGTVEPSLLAEALERSGDPCGAAAADPALVRAVEACRHVTAVSEQARAALGPAYRALGPVERAMADRRFAAIAAGGASGPETALAWRIERERGSTTLFDLEMLRIRMGVDWAETGPLGAWAVHVLRRRPGDSLLIAALIDIGEGAPDTIVDRLFAERKPTPIVWTGAALRGTELLQAREGTTTLETDTGGRAQASLWIATSPAATGRALLIVALPGSAGLGAEGEAQIRDEVARAMRGAVLIPSRWPKLTARPADAVDLLVPLVRDAKADERRSPWRTYPIGVGGSGLALPPGIVATGAGGAPVVFGESRPSTRLWFRGRFVDRDGLAVVVGDRSVAGSVDLFQAKSETEARAWVLPAAGAAAIPPAGDPEATLRSKVDATQLLAAETGATAVSLSRFRPSAGAGFEWVVERLAFGSQGVEIALPVAEGSSSVALYWIAATVRASGGAPPPAPVDLSSRNAIAFLRPAPGERREAFFKEGDLRSRDFTMIVPRGFLVTMTTEAIDGLPVTLSHRIGGAVGILDRFAALPDGGSIPAEATLTSVVRALVGRAGFELRGSVVATAGNKPAKSGNGDALEGNFQAFATGASGEDLAAGRVWVRRNADGDRLGLVTLSWGPERKERDELIALMAGSLKILDKKSR